MNKSSNNAIMISVGFVAGAVVSYFVTTKLVSTKFELDLQEQIDDVKNHYKLIRKEGEFATPVTTYEEVVEPYKAQEEKPLELWEEELLTETSSDEDEEVEEVVIVTRNTNEPYIITVEEFMEERDDLDKNTLTYFEEDDVLVDEREAVIPDVEATIGTEALTKFGEQSGDKNVVYVRNEKISMDFEITRDYRSFASVVLGIKDEKEVRKMREDD